MYFSSRRDDRSIPGESFQLRYAGQMERCILLLVPSHGFPAQEYQSHPRPLLAKSSSLPSNITCCLSLAFRSFLFLPSSKECAKAFHAAGSRLVLCGRDSEKLKDLAQELSTVTNHRKNVSVGEGKAARPVRLGFLFRLLQKLELLAGCCVEQ